MCIPVRMAQRLGNLSRYSHREQARFFVFLPFQIRKYYFTFVHNCEEEDPSFRQLSGGSSRLFCAHRSSIQDRYLSLRMNHSEGEVPRADNSDRPRTKNLWFRERVERKIITISSGTGSIVSLFSSILLWHLSGDPAKSRISHRTEFSTGNKSA